jgi:hypothetical protein
MANKDKEPYVDPVNEGICQVLSCPHPARYRASWAQGVVVRLVCASHHEEVKEKLFQELDPSLFGGKEINSLHLSNALRKSVGRAGR